MLGASYTEAGVAGVAVVQGDLRWRKLEERDGESQLVKMVVGRVEQDDEVSWMSRLKNKISKK